MNISRKLIVAIGVLFFNLYPSTSIPTNNTSHIVITLNVQNPGDINSTPSIPSRMTPSEGTQSLIFDTLMNQCGAYRSSLLVAGGGLLYLYLWYQLHQAHKLLKNNQAWCCWKHHIDSGNLNGYSTTELMKELLIDIQNRYIDPKNPSNSIAPISLFLPAVEKEMQQIEQYVWWATKIVASYSSCLFPVSKKAIEEGLRALQRLRFIKRLFISWWAQRNSESDFAKG